MNAPDWSTDECRLCQTTVSVAEMQLHLIQRHPRQVIRVALGGDRSIVVDAIGGKIEDGSAEIDHWLAEYINKPGNPPFADGRKGQSDISEGSDPKISTIRSPNYPKEYNKKRERSAIVENCAVEKSDTIGETSAPIVEAPRIANTIAARTKTSKYGGKPSTPYQTSTINRARMSSTMTLAPITSQSVANFPTFKKHKSDRKRADRTSKTKLVAKTPNPTAATVMTVTTVRDANLTKLHQISSGHIAIGETVPKTANKVDPDCGLESKLAKKSASILLETPLSTKAESNSRLPPLSHCVTPTSTAINPAPSPPTKRRALEREAARRMCTECEQLVSLDSHQRRMHVMQRHLTRPFSCPTCPLAYDTLCSLRKHSRRVHNQSVLPLEDAVGSPCQKQALTVLLSRCFPATPERNFTRRSWSEIQGLFTHQFHDHSTASDKWQIKYQPSTEQFRRGSLSDIVTDAPAVMTTKDCEKASLAEGLQSCRLCLPKLMFVDRHLGEHIMSYHLAEKPFRCNLCSTEVITKSSIVRHMRSKHWDSNYQGLGYFATFTNEMINALKVKCRKDTEI